MKNITYTILLCVSFSLVSNAQVGINTTTPDASSILDVTSTDKGVLVPRISLTSTTDVATIVTPTTSLLIYNTATIADVVPGYYYWNGTEWAQLATSKDVNKWGITGNSGTDDTVNFIGTTDDQDLIFKRNNSFAGRIGPLNTALGLNSIEVTATGTRNTAVGANTLSSLISAGSNTAIGYEALNSLLTGSFNIAVGVRSLKSLTTGGANTAVGTDALRDVTTGGSNVAVGFGTLRKTTTGGTNVAIGSNTMADNLTGFGNVALGNSTLRDNLTGFNNIALGAATLGQNTDGDFNVAVGSDALGDSLTGARNTAIGPDALDGNLTGNDNAALGSHALTRNESGNDNTAVGPNALDNVELGSNNIGIGHEARVPNGDLDNQVRIGNTAITYAGVEVAWAITSDARKKNTITNTNLGLNFINLIRPVSYFKNNDKRNRLEHGFIAQELEAALKTVGVTNSGMLTVDTEGMYSVRYNDLFAPIVKAIQEQTVSIETLKKENETLKLEQQKIVKELEEIKTLLLNKK